jgi:hypothetical protein
MDIVQNTSQKMVLHHHLNLQVLDQSWESDTLFILSSSPSSSIHSILQWHIFYHCLLIYYQNFCSDAARIYREFNCMYTLYICKLWHCWTERIQFTWKEIPLVVRKILLTVLSPPVSIYVFVWIINTFKAHCKPSTPFGRRVSTKWS